MKSQQAVSHAVFRDFQVRAVGKYLAFYMYLQSLKAKRVYSLFLAVESQGAASVFVPRLSRIVIRKHSPALSSSS